MSRCTKIHHNGSSCRCSQTCQCLPAWRLFAHEIFLSVCSLAIIHISGISKRSLWAKNIIKVVFMFYSSKKLAVRSDVLLISQKSDTCWTYGSLGISKHFGMISYLPKAITRFWKQNSKTCAKCGICACQLKEISQTVDVLVP